MDPVGIKVATGGHAHLLANISSEHHGASIQRTDDADAPALAGAYKRQRAKRGLAARHVKRIKECYWKKHKLWPHWIEHESEPLHWLGRYEVMVGNDPRGGSWDGKWWRFARQEWLDNSQDDALRQYEQPWITANPPEAHDNALLATQAYFDAARRRGESFESMLAADQHTAGAKKKARKGADAAGKQGGSKGSAAGAGGKDRGAGSKGGYPRSHWNWSQDCWEARGH